MERGLSRDKLLEVTAGPKHCDELLDDGLESEDTVTDVEVASAADVGCPLAGLG